MTNYTQALVLGYMLRGQTYTPPTTLYLAMSTTSPTEAEGSSGAPWNVTEPSAQTQLTSGLASGTAYTSLAVSALSAPIASGATVQIGTGGTTQTVTTSSAASAGDQTISVSSFTANANYSVGSLVADTTTGYVRQAVGSTTSNWAAITETSGGSTTTNLNQITYAAAAANYPGTVYDVALFDSAGGGNCVWYGPLATAVTIVAPFQPYFAPGAVVASLN